MKLKRSICLFLAVGLSYATVGYAAENSWAQLAKKCVTYSVYGGVIATAWMIEHANGYGCRQYTESGTWTFQGTVNNTTGTMNGTATYSGIMNCYTPPLSDSSASPACFAGSDKVEVEDAMGVRTIISMGELQVGDQVRVGSKGGQPVFDEVESFLHRETQSKAFFRKIWVRGVAEPLLITGDHLIKKVSSVRGGDQQKNTDEWILAKNLKIRDHLLYFGRPRKIHHIQDGVEKIGIYAPLTKSTRMIEVNGIAASCFSLTTNHESAALYASMRSYLDVQTLSPVVDNEYRVNPLDVAFLRLGRCIAPRLF